MMNWIISGSMPYLDWTDLCQCTLAGTGKSNAKTNITGIMPHIITYVLCKYVWFTFMCTTEHFQAQFSISSTGKFNVRWHMFYKRTLTQMMVCAYFMIFGCTLMLLMSSSHKAKVYNSKIIQLCLHMHMHVMFLLHCHLSDPSTHLVDSLWVHSYVSDLVVAPTPPHCHLPLTLPTLFCSATLKHTAHMRMLTILLPVSFASLTHYVLSACNTISVLDCT